MQTYLRYTLSPVVLSLSLRYFTSVTHSYLSRMRSKPTFILIGKIPKCWVRLDDMICFPFGKSRLVRDADIFILIETLCYPYSLFPCFLIYASFLCFLNNAYSFPIVLWDSVRWRNIHNPMRKNSSLGIFSYFHPLPEGYFRNERVCFRECTIFSNASINSVHSESSFET